MINSIASVQMQNPTPITKYKFPLNNKTQQFSETTYRKLFWRPNALFDETRISIVQKVL
jgi:hypothetical protein